MTTYKKTSVEMGPLTLAGRPTLSSSAPRATLFLLCYNQARTVARAVESALAQDYRGLEIILSDDCSTDDSFEMLEAAVENYKGRHTLELNRNRENLGLIGHVNKAFELASGELVVLAAGDDYSVPGRVSALVQRYLAEEPRPLLIHSAVRKVKDGILSEVWVPPVVGRRMRLVDMASAESLYIGASACVSRELYELFGPIRHEGAFEDLVLGFRAALLGRMSYIDEPLVDYTEGEGLSARIDSEKGERRQRIAARVAGCETIENVIQQRTEDLEKVAEQLDPALLKTLRKRLRQELHAIRVRQAFYRSDRSVLAEVGAGPSWRVFRGLVAEAAFLRRSSH